LHQPYCWQVALQQSLTPLQIDNPKIEIILTQKPTVFYHIACLKPVEVYDKK